MSWIQTFTGRKVDPLDMGPGDINIHDIAHALSLKCRFVGHVRTFYSVAQHSVLVARNVPSSMALWGLLHDAAEAYLPDIASPIKSCFMVADPVRGGFQTFKRLEAHILLQVAVRFGLNPLTMPHEVGVVDRRICLSEGRDLMFADVEEWSAAKRRADASGCDHRPMGCETC